MVKYQVMIKKIILMLILFSLVFFVSPNKILAGPQCKAEGGSCLTACNTSSTNLGTLDCTPQAGGKGPGIPTTCCIYQPPANQTNQTSDVLCPENKNGINTAIGCLNVLGGQDQFLGAILKWAVGIGGGIAFLLILYSGFMIMSAAGSPDRLKAGQELLTSALSGLILLVFSIFILKFIGIDILGLGDFGFGKTP